MIRVIDMSHQAAGPWCTTLLGDMGADVIKVEKAGRGDSIRHADRSGRLPPQIGGLNFQGLNRNKRGICVDIGEPAGVELIRRLVRDADVFVENFRPGVMDRKRLGYDDLRAAQSAPRLLLDHRLRPDRADGAEPGHGPHRPGHRRGHGPHRGGERSADQIRAAGRRPQHRRVRRLRHSRRALLPRAQRRRPARARGDARRGPVAVRRQRRQRAHRGHPLRPLRQRPPRPGALPGLPGQRRLLRRRLPHQRVLQAPVRGARPRGLAQRPALRHQPGSRRAPRRSGRHPHGDLQAEHLRALDPPSRTA